VNWKVNQGIILAGLFEMKKTKIYFDWIVTVIFIAVLFWVTISIIVNN
jgi:hypothetical protein